MTDPALYSKEPDLRDTLASPAAHANLAQHNSHLHIFELVIRLNLQFQKNYIVFKIGTLFRKEPLYLQEIVLTRHDFLEIRSQHRKIKSRKNYSIFREIKSFLSSGTYVVKKKHNFLSLSRKKREIKS